MATRKLVIVSITQVQASGGPAVDLKNNANAVLASGADVKEVKISVTLTTEAAMDLIVRLTGYYPLKELGTPTDAVRKRHKKNDIAFQKKRIKFTTTGSPATKNEVIVIDKEKFDEAQTVYIIEVHTRDGLARATCNIFRGV
jgi:hypothetical protein